MVDHGRVSSGSARSGRAVFSVTLLMLAGTLLAGCAVDRETMEKVVFGGEDPGVCGELDVVEEIHWLLSAEGGVSFVGPSTTSQEYFSGGPVWLGVANCAWTFGAAAGAGELGLAWLGSGTAEWGRVVAECNSLCEVVDGVGDGAVRYSIGENFVAYVVLTGESIGSAYLIPSGQSDVQHFSDGKGLELAEAISVYAAAQ